MALVAASLFPSRAERKAHLRGGDRPSWYLYIEIQMMFWANTPMDPSTFLGSVWGIIYYNLEAFLYLLRQCVGSIGYMNPNKNHEFRSFWYGYNYSADVKHRLLFATSRLIIGWYQVACIISPGQIPSWLWTGDGTLGHYAILVNGGSDFGMDIHIPY